MKSSGMKAELIGQLVSDWKLKFDFGEESKDDPSTCPSIADQCIPVFADIHLWTKGASFISKFTFMDLYEYLIHSTEKEFNRESMKTFKSLKAYKYFEDPLVRNVWVHNEETKAVIRCHCFSSSKSKSTYTSHVTKMTTGKVGGGGGGILQLCSW